ncbi:MAG: PAS domain S-box protein [Desulfobacterales bacterium]|nr:PAS domain S-box protein [Desulfobacterales bacterium]
MNKIMIVEDEAVIALGLEERLTEMGYSVIGISYSGDDALKKARRLLPDLVLMDIMIPGKQDGIDVAEILRTELDVPVIFLTAFSEENTIERAKKAQPYGYILKPFIDREIKAGIEVALYKKEMEKALRNSERRFKKFLDNLGDAAYETDAFGNVTYTNKAGEALTGLPLKKIIGKPFLPLFTEQSQTVAMDVYQRALDGECLEYVLSFVNGKTARFKNEPLMDEAGKVIGVFGIARDITHHRRVKKALMKSEKHYRSLAENSRVGFWEITLDGRTLYVNPAMCRMLEVEGPEDFHGKTYYSFYDAENLEIVKRELAKRKKGLSSTYEVELTGKKDTKRNVMVSGAPIFLSGDKIHSAIATVTDITDLKRSEKALMEIQNELEHRVEERTIELETALKEIALSEKELNQRKSALEEVNRQLLETNQAMSVLARNIDREKEGLEQRIYQITSSKIMPIVKELQADERCSRRQADLEVLATHLNNMTAGSSLYDEIDTSLTDQELRVAVMIKNGLTSHQIGDLLCISLHTVKTHRKNIRKKLKINSTAVNLVSYLKSKMGSDSI